LDRRLLGCPASRPYAVSHGSSLIATSHEWAFLILVTALEPSVIRKRDFTGVELPEPERYTGKRLWCVDLLREKNRKLHLFVYHNRRGDSLLHRTETVLTRPQPAHR